jgi:hypothetical protein
MCIYVRHAWNLAVIALCIDNCTIIAHQLELKGIQQLVADGFPINNLGEAKTASKLHCGMLCQVHIEFEVDNHQHQH